MHNKIRNHKICRYKYFFLNKKLTNVMLKRTSVYMTKNNIKKHNEYFKN